MTPTIASVKRRPRSSATSTAAISEIAADGRYR